MSAAAAAAAAAVVTRPSHSSARRYNGDLNQDYNRYNNSHTYPTYPFRQTPEDDYYYELYQNTVLKRLRSIEVAVEELHNLPATRYQVENWSQLQPRTTSTRESKSIWCRGIRNLYKKFWVKRKEDRRRRQYGA